MARGGVEQLGNLELGMGGGDGARRVVIHTPLLLLSLLQLPHGQNTQCAVEEPFEMEKSHRVRQASATTDEWSERLPPDVLLLCRTDTMHRRGATINFDSPTVPSPLYRQMRHIRNDNLLHDEIPPTTATKRYFWFLILSMVLFFFYDISIWSSFAVFYWNTITGPYVLLNSVQSARLA